MLPVASLLLVAGFALVFEDDELFALHFFLHVRHNFRPFDVGIADREFAFVQQLYVEGLALGNDCFPPVSMIAYFDI